MKRAIVALVLGVLAVLALVAFLNFRGEDKIHDAPPLTPPSGESVARGEYLVRAGMPFAGGRAIGTSFGTAYASNITPDPATGIGEWSADHFWRALHNGRSRDGRLLYPAWPALALQHAGGAVSEFEVARQRGTTGP